MDLGIAGKTAFVSGGSLGIGRAVAVELARNGVDVAITARGAARLEQAAAEISAATEGRVIAVPCDISKEDEIEAAVRRAREALGPIDILVNNAGASPSGRLDTVPDSVWQSSFDLKLMGYVRCARVLLPEMRARKWGRIINVVGRGGDIATPNYVLGAINAALLHFSRAIASDAARDGVMVNAVNPGAVNTPRWHEIIEQRAAASGRPAADVEAEWHARIPLGRAAEPEDIANLIAFLCSDRARYIAGAILNIDGAGAAGV